jgi:hypothetical protein
MRTEELSPLSPGFGRPRTRRNAREDAIRVRLLRLAYDRILLLQRARRAAARSSGSEAERLAFVCGMTRCTYEDAVWAIGQDGAPPPGRRLEAAIRKVREEGFPVPTAEPEARALAQLRCTVLAFAARDQPRRARPSATADPNSPIRDEWSDPNFSIGRNPNSPIQVQDLVRRARS